MTLTARDRKILAVVSCLALAAGFWFMVLGPKRGEAAKVGDDLIKEEQRRDQAVAEAARLNGARTSFAADYATVVELGRAIPATVDMPSIMLQLNGAAHGTGIHFDAIRTGERAAAPGGATPPASGGGSAPAPGGSAPPAGGGAQPASGSQPAGGSQPASGTPPAQGGQPQSGASGGGASAPPGGATSGAPGLESVPLEFNFRGNFFNLADFFHRLKRYVKVRGNRIDVRGRLLTIDSFEFRTEDEGGDLVAQVKATVYLTPKSQGVTAGASPSGPSAPPAAGAPAPQTASAPSAPTATSTP